MEDVMSKGCKIHRNVTWEGRCPVCLQNEIATLTAQVERLTKALTACFEWLENAPFDYNNGNTHEGIDEGNVLGWQTHASLMEIVLHALGKDVS